MSQLIETIEGEIARENEAKAKNGSKPTIEGILFDNDGTLVDTYDLILLSMRHATQTVLGRTIPDDELMRKIGQPLAIQVCDFTDDQDKQQEWLRVYREHNHAIHDDMVAAFPHVKEGLAELSAQGYKLGVVTSKMHWLAWRGLQVTGLAPYLDCCIGADDCTNFKPHPEPVERGAEALGLSPEHCIYVGDSPFDLQSGRDAGCLTAAATWGMFDPMELQALDPTITAHDFPELVKLIRATNG